MHLRTECGTRKILIAIPTKPPILKQQSHTQEQQGDINPVKVIWLLR